MLSTLHKTVLPRGATVQRVVHMPYFCKAWVPSLFRVPQTRRRQKLIATVMALASQDNTLLALQSSYIPYALRDLHSWQSNCGWPQAMADSFEPKGT